MEWWGNSGLLAPTGLLLDLYPGAAAAYSLQQLRTGVTNVVRVRRSSDNAESDFTAAQITDGTLPGWVGAGNNGFVRTWYDQSGNARDATQTSTSAQPLIVASGTLVTTNTRPAVRFNGVAQHLKIPLIAFTMNAFSVVQVAKSDSTAVQIGFNSPDPNRVYVPFISTNYYIGYAGSATTFDFGASNVTAQYLSQLNAGASQAIARRNNVAAAAVASSSASESGFNLNIGSYFNGGPGNFWNGTQQEVIFYTSDQASNMAGMAGNINARYAIY